MNKHREFSDEENEGTFEIWRCKECGWVAKAHPKGSIGTAHAHAEKHAPGTIFGFELPTTWLPTADPEVLGRYVDRLEVKTWKLVESDN